MLTLWGSTQRFCDGISRRGFLQVGAFGTALTLADMLRLRAEAGARPGELSVRRWRLDSPC